ncbi:HAD family hydrolase [Actinomycetospora sp. TBRC 11914]|uniref:HAD family hydrolase n=1 Tax=Actinomycetospora sp. TBRC 11914 TaxID=2729387 RepID=UPI00145E1A8D|nr:HAD family hydrolase [Actinomycetospora sp. TBRC 11914]NMO93635.1 HAD family hydrolase [Actinomycetospora sp. TBRC 11914]
MRALFDLTAAYEPSDDERRAPVPAVAAVLVDFSNTLFHMIDARTWLARVATASRRDLDPDAVLADVAAAAAAPEVVAAQVGRDLSDTAHREAMRAWFSRVPALAGAEDTAVDVLRAPDAWVPYPDTAEVLEALAAREVPVGVVSDIGWDIRVHARHAGLEHLVGSWTLSCELGAEKPDPAVFRAACASLGADPRATLMVGDNPARDGGATAVGCRAFLLPAEHRTGERGLRVVLDLVGQPVGARSPQ